MGLNLFDGSDDDVDDISKIQIDADYARRFEHNKKREDLQRFELLKKKGLVNDPSLSSKHAPEDADYKSELESKSDSDSEGEFYGVDLDKPGRKDAEFFNALIKVRNRDPSIKQEGVSLFQSDDDDESSGDDGSRDRKKKLYLKDVAAKQLIEVGPEFDDETVESSQAREGRKSYSEEQEENRRAFLEAAKDANDDRDGADFLREKKGENGGRADEGDVAKFEKTVEDYFGRKEELDENDAFLKDYFLNEMWIDKDGKKKETVVGDEELNELEDDEEEIWKQEDYENTFRHEEDLSDVIWGHSRHVEGSVRKVDNARKKQRKSKEERLKAAELERKEELKHLKNVKKEEMREKLKKLRQIAGIGEEEECQLDYGVLEDDFDPDKHDRAMKQVFDERYYAAEDVDPHFGSDEDDEVDIDMEKPDFSKEDELLGLPKGWDVSGSGEAFLAARKRSLKHKVENDDGDDDDDGDHDGDDDDDGDDDGDDDDDGDHDGDDDDDGDDDGDDDDDDNRDLADEEMGMQNEDDKSLDEGKRKRKRKLSLLQRAEEAMLEEYYKLDYEDMIGDLKTRFKYTKIKPNRYGLKAEDILTIDDSDLNQYISLKKLAPYREKEWKVPNQKRLQIKRNNDGDLEERKSKKHKPDKPKKSVGDDGLPSTSTAEEGKGGDGSGEDLQKLSRKARRRRQQAEFKLSESRLKAYGKIVPNSEKKK